MADEVSSAQTFLGLSVSRLDVATFDPRRSGRPVDDSHDIGRGPRAECSRCGTRRHWPGAERRCRVRVLSVAPMSLEDFQERQRADFETFVCWWLDAGHPTELDLRRWRAEFFEWQKIRVGRRRRR